MQSLCEGIAAAQGAAVTVSYTHEFAPTVNWPEQTAQRPCTPREAVAGADRSIAPWPPHDGLEDFGAFLEAVPEAFLFLARERTPCPSITAPTTLTMHCCPSARSTSRPWLASCCLPRRVVTPPPFDLAQVLGESIALREQAEGYARLFGRGSSPSGGAGLRSLASLEGFVKPSRRRVWLRPAVLKQLHRLGSPATTAQGAGVSLAW